MSPQVLVVSRDAMLLQTRQLILGTFFRTWCAGRIREVETLLSTYPFDLVILCYTLNEVESRYVIDLATQQMRHPRILMLAPIGTPVAEADPGELVMTEAGPYYLLKRTAELLGVEINPKAKPVPV